MRRFFGIVLVVVSVTVLALSTSAGLEAVFDRNEAEALGTLAIAFSGIGFAVLGALLLRRD
jgi:hypothetical protein